MKREVLFIIAIAVLFIVAISFITVFATTSSEAASVHKRTVDGVVEYEAQLANETPWYVVVLINGRRQEPLSPNRRYPNMWDGSMKKTWLSTEEPYTVVAFAYMTREDITNDKPSFRMPEQFIDIRDYIDEKRNPDGSFRIPHIAFAEDNFDPWATPRNRDRSQGHGHNHDSHDHEEELPAELLPELFLDIFSF